MKADILCRVGRRSAAFVRDEAPATKLAGMTDPGEAERQTPQPVQGGAAEQVSDSDRDETVNLLREHVIVGRLTLDEFSERVGLALKARTRGDLQSALANLPSLAAPPVESVRYRSRRWVVAVMSGSRAKGRWRISGRTTAVAVMGGCEMDLRYAEIDGPEVVITAVAFWGGISVIVPEGFDVELRGFSLMGGRDLKLRSVPLVPSSPRIRVRGVAVMGGVHVRSRPSRTAREIDQSTSDHVGIPHTDNLSALGGPSDVPIDLDALDRTIKEQIHSHRDAASQNDREKPQSRTPRREATVTPDTPSGSEGTVTILFSDMVDYAGMTERLGDRTSRELLRAHHQIVRELLKSHGGREVKVQGDGFMVAFGGVARALRCATQIQRSFLAYSDTHGDRPIRVHMGVHTGEVVEEDDDFLGHTVNVASRLADAAAPGEILVSSLSAQMVERTDEFRFVDQREAILKGLIRSQTVLTLVWAA